MKKVLVSLFISLFSFLVWSNNALTLEEINIRCNKINESIYNPNSYAMIDSLLQSVANTDSHDALLKVYDVKYRYHLVHKESELAKDAFKRYMEICQQALNSQQALHQLNELIKFSLTNGNNIPLVLEENKEYQKLALQSGNTDAIMNAYFNTGTCYYVWGYYITALHHFRKAIDYGEKNELHLGYNVYQNAAECARIAGDNETSTAWQKKAIDLYKENPDEANAFIYLLSGLLRNYIIDKGQVSDSIIESTFKELQQEKEKHQKLIGSSQNRYNDAVFAYYLDYKKDADKAVKYVNESDYLMAILNKGRAYMATKEYKKAAESYKLAFEKIYDAQQSQINYMLSQFVELEDYELLQEEVNYLNQQKMNLEFEWVKKTELINKEKTYWQIALASLIALLLIIYIVRRIVKRIIKKRKLKNAVSQDDVEKIKSLFIQNMAYEVKSPLNAVVNFNEMLNSENDRELTPTEKEQMTKLLKSNAKLLQSIVNDIIDMSQFENGTYKPTLTDFNVQQVCQSVLDNARNTVKPGVELILDCNPSILIMHTDAHRLQQLLSNLMSNACKYTTQGSIKLTYMKDANKVIFSVADTGIGIKTEDADKIFQRFEMLNDSVIGTGVGLYICQQIAELLNGKIYLDKSYSPGARFILELPLF